MQTCELDALRDRITDLDLFLDRWEREEAVIADKIAVLEGDIVELNMKRTKLADGYADELDQLIPGWRTLLQTDAASRDEVENLATVPPVCQEGAENAC